MATFNNAVLQLDDFDNIKPTQRSFFQLDGSKNLAEFVSNFDVAQSQTFGPSLIVYLPKAIKKESADAFVEKMLDQDTGAAFIFKHYSVFISWGNYPMAVLNWVLNAPEERRENVVIKESPVHKKMKQFHATVVTGIYICSYIQGTRTPSCDTNGVARLPQYFTRRDGFPAFDASVAASIYGHSYHGAHLLGAVGDEDVFRSVTSVPLPATLISRMTAKGAGSRLPKSIAASLRAFHQLGEHDDYDSRDYAKGISSGNVNTTIDQVVTQTISLAQRHGGMQSLEGIFAENRVTWNLLHPDNYQSKANVEELRGVASSLSFVALVGLSGKKVNDAVDMIVAKIDQGPGATTPNALQCPQSKWTTIQAAFVILDRICVACKNAAVIQLKRGGDSSRKFIVGMSEDAVLRLKADAGLDLQNVGETSAGVADALSTPNDFPEDA